MVSFYVPHTWSEFLMTCVNIFSTISSGNWSQPLKAIAGVSSEIWLFWLFSNGLLSRGWFLWIISLIRFSIQSSPLDQFHFLGNLDVCWGFKFSVDNLYLTYIGSIGFRLYSNLKGEYFLEEYILTQWAKSTPSFIDGHSNRFSSNTLAKEFFCCSVLPFN